MSTTTNPTVPAQPIEPCAPHGVRHKPGSQAEIACAAISAATHPTPASTPAHAAAGLIEVTPDHLQAVLSTWRGRLARLVLPDGTHMIIAGGWEAGETIADASDVRSMIDHWGSLEAAAAILTDELRWEQKAAA